MIDITFEEFSIDVHKTYDLLVNILENRGYTPRDLACEFNITETTIYNYNKRMSIPSLNVIDGLCRLVTGDGYYILLALKGLARASLTPDFGKRCKKLRLDNKLKGSDVYKPLYGSNAQLSGFETGKSPMTLRLFYCYWRIFNDKMPFDVLYRTLVKRNIITITSEPIAQPPCIKDNKTTDVNTAEYDIVRTGELLKNIRLSRSIIHADIISKYPIFPSQISKIESRPNNISIDVYLNYIKAILRVNLFRYIGLQELDTPDLNTALRDYRINHNVSVKNIVKCGINRSMLYRIENCGCRITFKHVWYYIKAVEGRTIRDMIIDELQKTSINCS